MPPKGPSAVSKLLTINPIPETPGGTSGSVGVEDAEAADEQALARRKRARVEDPASVVAPPARGEASSSGVVPPSHGVELLAGMPTRSDAERAGEEAEQHSPDFWTSRDGPPPPTMNPRQLLLESTVGERHYILDRTYLYLHRAYGAVADYKLLLDDYADLKERADKSAADLEKAKSSLEKAKSSSKKAIKARTEAEAKLEKEKKRADEAAARVTVLEADVQAANQRASTSESRAKNVEARVADMEKTIRQLQDDNLTMAKDQADVMGDTWKNCLTQLRFFYPHLEFDEGKLSSFRCIDKGVVLECVGGNWRPVDPQPEVPRPTPSE